MTPSPLDALLVRPIGERRLGPYLLEAPLGRGGFAPVWRAREVYGGTEVRVVAVKLFRLDAPAPVDGTVPLSSRQDRVIQEARALCRVEHPGIVRFYTLHIDDSLGLLALVMEHLDGRSLDQRLREQGTLGVREAAALGAQLASALGAVHAAGLVHRDVKPANLIEVRGGYRLIDFGIAASEAPRPASPARRVVLDDLPFEAAGTNLSLLLDGPSIGSTALTGVGGLASGTVGYMDPLCVATGEPATVRSDLYGLGALLFEAITGRLPAASPAGLRGEVLDGRAPPPSIASLAPDTPAPIARRVDTLLSPDRDARPASAAEVEATLAGWLGQSTAPSVSLTPGAPPPADAPGPDALATSETAAVVATTAVATTAPLEAIRQPGRKKWAAPAVLGLLAVAGLTGAVVMSLRPAPCVVGSEPSCRVRCEGGEAASCHALGLMYEQGVGVGRDEARAATLFGLACDAGHGAACRALGSMREQGRGGARDDAEARRRQEQACKLDDMQGCNALAILLDSGLGGPPDRTRAVQLYQRACDRGYPNGCANLGALYERGEVVERDESRARSLYERACSEGTSSACGLLAVVVLAGRGGPADPERAATLFEKACASGHAFACVGLGFMFEQGKGGVVDRAKAADRYRAACDEGERQGCFYLGRLYQQGQGLAADETQAFVLFQRACDRGLPAACRQAGEASATGRGVTRDDPRAVAFFRRACTPPSAADAPDAESCAWLAQHHRDGRGVDRSPEQAAILQERACSLGARLGCPPPAPR